MISVSGRDTRTFLHAQLTQDVANLRSDKTTLAAWADPRGRVRALFHVVPAGEQWLLVTSADLIAMLLSKLKMFVLRADVALARADALAVYAVFGAPAEATGTLRLAHDVYWLAVGQDLVYAVGADDAIRAACAGLEEAPAAEAELAAIRAGLPAVDAASTERYLPQMLDLDRLGGVAFDKGCYPGQEVIARTHHLGTVKRRLRRLAGATVKVPVRGTALTDDAGEPAGEVLRAARAPEGVELLAVARLDLPAERLRLEGEPLAVGASSARDS